MIDNIPKKVFLDTSVVNFICNYGEQIHEYCELPVKVNRRVARDIDALQGIWTTGRKARWKIVISRYTIHELAQTTDPSKRDTLLAWASEIVAYQKSPIDVQTVMQAAPITVRESLSILPDAPDRKLILDALKSKCDTFCTRDWKTLLRLRPNLKLLPINVIAPHEWWEIIRPFAGLWV